MKAKEGNLTLVSLRRWFCKCIIEAENISLSNMNRSAWIIAQTRPLSPEDQGLTGWLYFNSTFSDMTVVQTWGWQLFYRTVQEFELNECACVLQPLLLWKTGFVSLFAPLDGKIFQKRAYCYRKDFASIYILIKCVIWTLNKIDLRNLFCMCSRTSMAWTPLEPWKL